MMYCDWDERHGAVRATSRRVLATLTPTSAHAACAIARMRRMHKVTVLVCWQM